MIRQSGMNVEEVATSLGVNVSSLQQISPVFNIDITNVFNKNKTAVGNQSIAGDDNLYNSGGEKTS
ncbi:MAG: hypothetical protein LUH15_01290 [Tannerellaceae bacterium]|nr:hypothetical protein [Tannerellaceae bacterium]